MRDLPIYERIDRDMAQRERDAMIRRSKPAAGPGVDCASNSYLSLEHEPEVALEANRLCGGRLGGNTASRLVRSVSPLFEELEAELADWKKTEASLLFASGYAANVGVLQALAGRHTEVFCDRLNHASIYDGIRLSGASLVRYRHSDMADLLARLSASTAAEKVVVTDTVFSMDGDVAPLADIAELAEQFGALLMLDEAHATGVLGPALAGAAEEAGISGMVDVSIGTLSKATAGMGGFFTGSSLLREFLVNHSRSFIYSTALPQSVLAWDLAAVRYIREHPQLGPDVRKRAHGFRQMAAELGFDCGKSCTPIVPLITGDPHKALSLSKALADESVHAPAIRPPTVPAGAERVRVSINRRFDEAASRKVRGVLEAWSKA